MRSAGSSTDDVAAICAAYPPGEVAECNIDPEGGLGGCDGREPPRARCSAAPATSPASSNSVIYLVTVATGLIALRRVRYQTVARMAQ